MTGEPGGGGPRRFLIAVAVADHAVAGPGWDRPGLYRAREDLVRLFTGRFGYKLVETVGMNPTAAQLLDALDRFCHDDDRRPDDMLAVYFTGHGERLDELDRHVLFTADTDPDRPHLAARTSDIADAILYKTPVRRLLLMLDTCYSGSGGAEFAAKALDSYLRRWGTKVGDGIVVLSSAQPRQLAEAGRFPRLLTEAAGSLAAAGYSPPIIAIPALVSELRKHGADPAVQDIVYHLLALTEDIPEFLPNPRHHPSMTGVDLALQQAQEWEDHAERREVEFRTRLLVRAMGNRDGKGWWFCGRRAALTDITTWLTRPDPNRPLLAVTGNPGSGKTAVLGLIAALAHSEYRDTVPVHSLNLPPEAVPNPGIVDVAIYAQNLTIDQVRDGIAAAAQLSVSTIGELAEALHEREAALTVLIDGLDEATEPRQLARKLLRPLLDHACDGIRLLVGTRPYLLDEFGLTRESALDLDAPRHADLDALRTYAIRGLVAAAPDSIYTDQRPPVIRAVASAIAEQAYPSFLVTRIVAATLSADPKLPNTYDPAWRASLPALPGDAMRRDLQSRLGEDAQRARNLLRPLALAQGQGLPWEDLWASIASQMAGITYTDEDLMWLRHTAGSYVVEATENGRSAYRLYHQALAEHLIRDHDSTAAHTAFVHVLKQRVPLDGDGYPDWELAHPYTLRYLATHAAHAGLIDELITDTDYLVHAEPAPLLAAMLRVESEDGLLTRAIYRCHHHHLPPIRRRQVLAIEAARFGAARQQHQLSRRTRWKIRWATGTLTHPAHRSTLTGHTSWVEAVECSTLAGHAVAVTTGDDGTVRVWDLTTGSLTTGTERAVLASGHGAASAVACTMLDGDLVAVTGSHDHTVRVWDLATGIERAEFTGHRSAVRAVACTAIDGHPVAVTGSRDRTVRVWDLITGAERAVLHGHTGSVSAVACTVLDGHAVAVTGGDDDTVRVWDLNTGVERAVLTGHAGWVGAVVCTAIDGQPIAVTGSSDRTVRVWDLTTGTERAILTGHTGWVQAVACTMLDGHLIAVTGSDDNTVRVWDLATPHPQMLESGPGESGQAPAMQLTRKKTGAFEQHAAHAGWGWAVASTTLGKDAVAVICSHDEILRVWDLRTGLERARLAGQTAAVLSVACTMLDGCPVAVTSDVNTVRVWDLATGTEHAVLPAHIDISGALACTIVDEHPVAVIGTEDGTVRVWDLTTRTQRTEFIGHRDLVLAVDCTAIDGHPVAVTGSDDGTVRVWDLAAESERAVFVTDDGSVNSVACTAIDGRPVAVTGSRDGTVRIWDLTTETEHGVLTGHTDKVMGAACTQLHKHPVAITGSYDRTVRMWDLVTMSTVAVLDCPERVRFVHVGPGSEIIVGLDGDIAVLDYLPPA
ncbi:caspase family protein [Nocardia brasiliensis]|uniref:caspase family protein n=2 Tax=Nocardia brasiliensis TaxID=37326 RepID=UPI0003173EB0|nr:caspase family protein [Nocardia brasiliensis]